MDSEVSASTTSSTPQIIGTEPSPVPVVRKMESIPEVTQQSVPQTTCGIAGVPESSKMPLVQASPVAPSPSSSGESARTARNQPSPSSSSSAEEPAQDSNVRSEPVVNLLLSAGGETATSESNRAIRRDFMSVGARLLRSPCILACLSCYAKVWKRMQMGFALLFWGILIILPVSGAVISPVYETSCPAYLVVTILILLVGLIQTTGFVLRAWLYIHFKFRHGDTNGRQMLRNLLVSTLLTLVLFIAESVAFWKMTPSPDNLKYCGDIFPTFAFWWNCIMPAVIVPSIIFPF